MSPTWCKFHSFRPFGSFFVRAANFSFSVSKFVTDTHICENATELGSTTKTERKFASCDPHVRVLSAVLCIVKEKQRRLTFRVRSLALASFVGC